MDIIGLHGIKRAGKDTAAGALDPMGWTRLAFADELRGALYTVNPYLHDGVRMRHVVDAVGWEGAKKTGYKDEFRRLLQYTGDACRALDPDIFVTPVVGRIHTLARTGCRGVVVTDVRFDNEARGIIEAGGAIIEIDNPNLVADDTHTSEQGISPELVAETVVNDADIPTLHARVLTAVTALTAGTLAAAA